MDVCLVLATLRDLPCVMRLMEAFHFFDHDGPFDFLEAEQTMRQLINQSELGRIWLIKANGDEKEQSANGLRDKQKVVGYVAVTFSLRVEARGRCAFVDELFVEEAYRGRGVGKGAIARLKQACRELGIIQLHLEVLADNPHAQRLYKREGFNLQPRSLMTVVLKNEQDDSKSTEIA